MILFVGQIARRMRGPRGLPGGRLPAMFGARRQVGVEIDDAARIPEILARAFRVAMQGRPGPVVVALPEDMLDDVVAVADAPRVDPGRAGAAARPTSARLRAMLDAGATAGGAASAARAGREAAAERPGRLGRAPTTCRWRSRSGGRSCSRPTIRTSPANSGIGPNPALVARIRDADLLLMVGGRLSEMPAQSYGLLGIPDPGLPLVHVHPDAGGTRPRLPAGAGDRGGARTPSARPCADFAPRPAPARPCRRGPCRYRALVRDAGAEAGRVPVRPGDHVAARAAAARTR